MTRPVIEVIGARPAAHTATPAVLLRLRIRAGGRVHAAVLRAQVHLDARRRSYAADERARLYELFGDSSHFSRTLRPIVWAHVSLTLPPFDDACECDLAVPCTYDLTVASAKYLHAVREGEIPLQLLFSGSIFRVADGTISVEPVPWDLQAPARLPAGIWRATMDQFFPGGGWIRLQQDTIDRLQAFRGDSAMTSWDDVIDRLLAHARSEVAS